MLNIVDWADIIGNSFRPVRKSSIIFNLLEIKKHLPPLYKDLVEDILKRSTLQLMKLEIEQVIDKLTEVVNEKTIAFMEKEIKYQDIV